jgi:chromosome segregation ATPase
MNEILAYVGTGTGFLAVLGTMITRWLDAKIKDEARQRQAMMTRITDLESKLLASTTRIAELELKIMSKTFELRELEIKYQALAENYHELLDRYRASEESGKKLMERLVSFTGEQKLRGTTPQAFPKPQPHIKGNGDR